MLKKKGCHILIFPHPIQRDDDQIWISPGLSEVKPPLFNYGFQVEAGQQTDVEQPVGLHFTGVSAF